MFNKFKWGQISDIVEFRDISCICGHRFFNVVLDTTYTCKFCGLNMFWHVYMGENDNRLTVEFYETKFVAKRRS